METRVIVTADGSSTYKQVDAIEEAVDEARASFRVTLPVCPSS